MAKFSFTFDDEQVRAINATLKEEGKNETLEDVLKTSVELAFEEEWEKVPVVLKSFIEENVALKNAKRKKQKAKTK